MRSLLCALLLPLSLFAKEIIVTEQDFGKNIEVERGDTFRITLHENPSTGYQWEVKTLDETMMRLIEKAYVPSRLFSEQHRICGAGGTTTFTFLVEGKGVTPCQLIYHRAWEQTDPLETFDLTISVR